MTTPSQPSPDRFFQIATAYQDTAALQAAIELDVFTALSEGPLTAEDIAKHCKAAARGIRILCDYMTMLGFLAKSDSRYALTPDSAVFLNRKSPAYAGGAMEFLLADHLVSAFRNLTESVRKGGTADPHRGSVAPEHPMWLTFARAMGGIMVRAAEGLAELLPFDANRPGKVLDVSASHGNWGIAIARRNPKAQLIALDWAPVLELTRENARAAGIADRFQTLPGSAFEVEWGTDYDAILAPNFLHHFSTADCVRFMKKAHAALRPGGTLAIVEFVPNPDRVTPPGAAGFSLVMLATTPEGDAYTFDEYAGMLAEAGFQPPEAHSLPASVNTALLARK